MQSISKRQVSQSISRLALLLASTLTMSSGIADSSIESDVAVEKSVPIQLISPYTDMDIDHARVEQPDLLTTLRWNFILNEPTTRRTELERNWYVRHPEYLDRVFKRGQRYLPHIIAELKRRNLPLELALLPIVESAFDPFAYSHGRAAGLWQMIPGTARQFGIEQNWWFDGRRDILESTRAALDYLEYLHRLNKGDWLNAIASYNSGQGNVLRSRKRNRAAGKPDDFWNLKLPRETSMYVPKLLALVEIVDNPEKFGLSLPRILDEPQFSVVDIQSQLDLALAAELAGVDVDTIYAYNPAYNRWATDPAGPHRLVLPIDVAGDFAEALADVPAAERLRWQRHKIRNGEAISQIAQRFNTTVPAIRAANDLRGNTIRAGDYLLIPVASKPLAAYSKSADARLEKQQNRQRPGEKIEHVVRNAESFWTISRRYGVSTRQLAAWNGMAPGDTLPVGRKLVVWTQAGSQASVTPSTAPGNMTRKLNYTVRNGDSLYLIASRFRVSIGDLTRWNKLDKNKILRPGQKITMYVDVAAQSS